MKFLKTTRLFLTFAVSVGFLFSSLLAADGFMPHPGYGDKLSFGLMKRVHKEQWTIYWGYDENCLPEAKNNGAAIEEAIVWALQVWLQPIRDLKTSKPVVNDFRIVLWDKEGPFPEERDLSVEISCEEGWASARVPREGAPFVLIREEGADVTLGFRIALIHELGHALGLADTYLTWRYSGPSSGGLPNTVGHQPLSVMSAISTFSAQLPGGFYDSPWVISPSLWLTQDDINGIVWLYKVYYENLPIDNCFFPDYELEEPPLLGCRPKHLLIFEVKQRIFPEKVLALLEHDKEIDVNAKDGSGSTALHYATKLGDADIVEVLLAHPDIDVNSRDAKGYTAALYAAEAGHTEVENLIRAHEDFDSDLHQSLPKIPADVNGDGTVNIQDLVLVSSRLGETGENRADVNGDGIVNIQDLVFVAGAF